MSHMVLKGQHLVGTNRKERLCSLMDNMMTEVTM